MTTAWTNATDIDLSDTDFWARPPAEREAAFALLRSEHPFSFHAEPVVPFIRPGPGYYAVTRHADIETISSQPAVFCSGAGAVSIADLPAELSEFYGSVISMDDPRHAKIWRIVARAFTPRMLEKVMDSVERLASDLVAEARRRAEQGDVRPRQGNLGTAAAAGHLRHDGCAPARPRSRAAQHQYRALRRRSRVRGGRERGSTHRLGGGCGARRADDADGRGAGPATHRGPDLGAGDAEVDGERLTHQEIASFFILLCVAGNETTRTAISHGVLALSQFPDQRARWRADASLTKTAVEEIVRWATPVTWMRRTATRDVELAGRQFHQGEKFLLFYNSANRDEDVFADPFVFDLGRNPNPHLGFGGQGPHFCLGANLARREIALVFRALFTQMPGLEVIGEPVRLRSSFINGIKSLPVAWRG